MKQTFYFLIISFGLLSCTNQPKQVENKFTVDSVPQPKEIDNSKYYTQLDTILIITEFGDTLKYAKAEFNQIVDKHSEFFEENPSDPDLAYILANDYEEFGSEAGMDTYFILYAHFLKQRNGISAFAQQRQKLIDIYSNINSLYSEFEYGGTFYGHQNIRILGYAEYSIYLIPKTKDYIPKTYDITKQKDLYIKSLRQLIEDESSIDQITLGQEKIKRNKNLNKIVDKLEMLITDKFYLHRAQEYQYENYE